MSCKAPKHLTRYAAALGGPAPIPVADLHKSVNARLSAARTGHDLGRKNAVEATPRRPIK
jgi:hypothetical protein